MGIWRLVVLLALLSASFVAYAHGEEPVDLVKEIKDYLQRESGKAPSAEEVVDTLNLYVAGQFRDGDRRNALEAAERALQYAEAELGEEHPAALQSMSNLAALYDERGRYGAAEPLYRRALAGREKVLGAEHPDTLQSINSLAGLYYSQKRYADAEPLYRRALAVQQNALGGEHPDTLQSMSNLAVIYDLQKHYDAAEPLYRRALAGRAKVLGPDHPDTRTIVENLATLYEAQGRNEEAVLVRRQY